MIGYVFRCDRSRRLPSIGNQSSRTRSPFGDVPTWLLGFAIGRYSARRTYDVSGPDACFVHPQGARAVAPARVRRDFRVENPEVASPLIGALAFSDQAKLLDELSPT